MTGTTRRTSTGRTVGALGAVVAIVVALTALAGPGGAQVPAGGGRGPSTPTPVEVTAAVADGGEVAVIVELREPFTPEGALSPGAVAAQRSARDRAADGVLSRLPAPARATAKRFATIPYLATTVDAAGLAALEADPEVASIQPDAIESADLATSTARVGATDVWAGGITGDGQTVAVVDTGVESTHPFLAGKVVAEACFSKDQTVGSVSSTSVCPDAIAPAGTTSAIGPGAGAPCPIPGSDCDHGTHVAGIAAGGDGTSGSGMAHGADIIAVQVFSQFPAANCGNGATSPCALTWVSDQILGLEHVYSLRGTYDIAAVNMSLGGSKQTSACTGDARRAVVQNLAAAGIATVASSGNDGFTDAMGAPACIPEVISVGATSKSSDFVASYSNSASFLDLLAPGSNIRSSVPGGGYANYYGTSMASPHVAGAFALLAEGAPGTLVSQRLDALIDTGVPSLDSKSGITTPRIQVDDALAALAGAPPAVTDVSPAQGLTTGGTTVTVTGAGFTGATAVRFGPTPAASFDVVNDTTIEAVTPARPAALVTVFVEGPTGTSAGGSPAWFSFLDPPTAPPTVTDVHPHVGTVDGGTTVTIRGDDLLTATSVSFGPTPAASYTIVNDSTIEAVTPARPVGLVNVKVTTSLGTNANQPSSWYSFRVTTGPAPTVSSTSPNKGPAAGGTAVTLTGTGFTGATAVRFGPTSAATYSVVNDSTIQVTTPARPTGLVNITVVTQNGVNQPAIASWYVYQ